MTDLTEQWKKGELPSGWYYVKCLCENEDRIDYYNASFGCWTSNGKYIKQVLAPVPSYEEWKSADNCMLENEVLRLKNAQLKELLKECKEIFDECFSPSAKHGELYKKIDEALK